MHENIVSLKRTARLAGLLYLVLGLLGFYAIMYVPNRIFVRGDTATSAKNLLTDEFLFRTSIVSHLLSVVTFLFLAFVLYKLFRKVNEQQAKLLVALVVVQVPIIFLLETFDISSLMTLKGQVFKAATHAPLQDVSQLFLKIRGYGLMTVEIFWGLWLIPFGLLVYKSVFIPRVLGVLLISAGLGYTIDSLTFLLFPGLRDATQPAAMILSGLGEGSTILWLLIIGAKDHLSITVFSESDARSRPDMEKIEHLVQ